MWQQISTIAIFLFVVLYMGAALAWCWSISRSLFLVGLPYWLLKLYLCNQDQGNSHWWAWLAGAAVSEIFILCSRRDTMKPDPLLVDLNGAFQSLLSKRHSAKNPQQASACDNPCGSESEG